MICLDEAQCATGGEEAETERSLRKGKRSEKRRREEGQRGRTSEMRNCDRVKEGDE